MLNNQACQFGIEWLDIFKCLPALTVEPRQRMEAACRAIFRMLRR